jgi:fatty-acyl-CoA synthase
MPDTYWGEEVAAVIIPKQPEDPPSPEQLHNFCREHLAAYKTPRIWCFTVVFPTTETGKLQKFRLIELIAQGELRAQRTRAATQARP